MGEPWFVSATLYLSFGKPRAAAGVDVGEGVILRYDEASKEVIGITIVGIGKRLEQCLRKQA